jgi:phosphate transport system permease protein
MGDRALFALCAVAGLVVVATLVGLAYQVFHQASPAISRFGLGFLTHGAWAPNFNRFGASDLIYGTVVSSLFALFLAGPLGIGIAIYLSMIAAPGVRAIVGPMVEMLAAVPSVILGFWGVLILAPFLVHIQPALHSVLGFIPLFGTPQTVGTGIFTASIVLTLMMLPIVSALCRDLFLTVPQDLKDGAEALGATRWEVIRGVVLPSTVSGISAALVLGLGRALGEAIAVSLVIGNATAAHASLFEPGASLAGRIATEFPSTNTSLYTASLFYCGAILLVIGLLVSLAARAIAGRFDVERSMARAAVATAP